jgi:hypothetical protein
MKLSTSSIEYFTQIALMTHIPVHKVAQDALKLNIHHQRIEKREKEWKQWAKDMMALEGVTDALAPSGSLGSLRDRFVELTKPLKRVK